MDEKQDTIPERDFNKSLTDLYGDYIIHMAQFKTKEACEQYLSKLSFIKGNNLSNISTPSHMKFCTEMYPQGPFLQIGGQFKKEENFEILSTLQLSNIEPKSLMVAKKASLVYNEFLEASKLYKEFLCARMKKKRWWKFW